MSSRLFSVLSFSALLSLAWAHPAGAVTTLSSSNVSVSGTLGVDGTVTLNGALKLTALDCTGNANGGKLTALADGTVVCDDDATGGGIGADSLDFSEFADALTVDAPTTVSLGAQAFTIDLTGTADFTVAAAGTPFAIFADDGTVTFDGLTVTDPIIGSVTGSSGSTTGNAATATALQTARTINGVSFDGTGNIAVTADAGTLTGTTLNSTVVTSSLTTVGALASGSIASGFGTISTGNAITTSGTMGTAATTTFTGATMTASGEIAANGGITFDNASDALGAHALAGTLDAGNNLIVNIGNAGTDFTASGGLTLANSLTIGGGTAIVKHLSATASLDFGATAAGTCDSLTITVTGAADGDTVALGIPAALATSSSYQSFQGFVSAADTVTVKRCNLTNALTALSNPAAATVRADVWQH